MEVETLEAAITDLEPPPANNGHALSTTGSVIGFADRCILLRELV